MASSQVNTNAAAELPVTPGTGGSGTSPYGNGQSGTGQSGSGQSGTGQSGSGQSGTGQSGTDPYSGGFGRGQSGSGQSGTSGTSSQLGDATAAQQVGIVDIDTVLSYEGAEAAGTGLVLTDTGEILTNNHVVAGSTSITVTIISSGESYPATVVGTDATDDVAVLQLTGASGLATASIATSGTVNVGDAVTGVGNAGGVGGVPDAAPGYVTALNQTITTEAEGSAAGETLNGLIETNADIQAGDSGGPLFNADDQVVGIDTAAEAGSNRTAGYAIPINSALTIVSRIEAGQSSENIVIGYPAFLGVQVSSTQTGSTQSGTLGGSRGRTVPTTTAGALISGVVSGGPAAAAGLAAGDTITAVDGTTISDPSGLTAALAADKAGQNVDVSWVDSSGAAHQASVTLAQGPAA